VQCPTSCSTSAGWWRLVRRSVAPSHASLSLSLSPWLCRWGVIIGHATIPGQEAFENPQYAANESVYTNVLRDTLVSHGSTEPVPRLLARVHLDPRHTPTYESHGREITTTILPPNADIRAPQPSRGEDHARLRLSPCRWWVALLAFMCTIWLTLLSPSLRSSNPGECAWLLCGPMGEVPGHGQT
jgi:hypothetical protein